MSRFDLQRTQLALIFKLDPAQSINPGAVQADNFKPPADWEAIRHGAEMCGGREGDAVDRIARGVVIMKVDKADFIAGRQSHETDVKFSYIIVLKASFVAKDLKRVHRGSAIGSIGFGKPDVWRHRARVHLSSR